MNHAYIDASWQEGGETFGGLGGWGLVLVCPARLPELYGGQLTAADNNEAELRAAWHALALAPAGQPLTVHSDNQSVIACLGRGQGPPLLADDSRAVIALAGQRGIELQIDYESRNQRHMQRAHQLANVARKAPRQPASSASQVGSHSLNSLHSLASQTDVLLEQKKGCQLARISLRRPSDKRSERLIAQLRLDLSSSVPPSLQVLLAAVRLLRPNENALIRRSSKLARALWDKPERALLPDLRQLLEERRAWAKAHGLCIELE